MSPDEATHIFARLIVHWPQLGGEDVIAQVRAQDWTRVIERSSAPVGQAACTLLVEGRADHWPPTLGEWQDACRQTAERVQYEDNIRAIAPAKEPMVPRERFDALMEQARSSLGMPRAKPGSEEYEMEMAQRLLADSQASRNQRHSDIDPLEPALAYDEVYLPSGEPRPEHAAEVARMQSRDGART